MNNQNAKRTCTILSLVAVAMSALGAADPSPTELDIAQLHKALGGYFQEYNTLPVGNSGAIMKSLVGDNPRRLIFFAVSAARTGPNGTFLDAWKTGFRITISKSNTAEVRSAGPDRDFGTSDDIFASKTFP